MWINKFIAHTGYCSRREADKLVEEGRVTVNGEVAPKTLHVSETDTVKIDDKYLPPPKRHRIYIAVNKPVGIVCTTETNIEHNIIDFVGHEERIFPIGRMDRESSGLLFLTNDGDIVNRFTEEEFGVEKEYFVRLDQKITFDFIQKLLHEGIPLEGKLVKAIRVVKTGPKALKITILQDMRRQIRRMCSYCGFRVFKCERIRIMHIHVRDIPVGDWRYLTRHEVMKMFRGLNYHPAQKWLLPGETNESLELEAQEMLSDEPLTTRPDIQPEYRDESKENQSYRPRDNRGGGYRQDQRGGGYQQRGYQQRGGYQPRYQQPYDNRYQQPYDNRGGDRYPPRDNRYQQPYDNRGGGDRYQQRPYDNRGGGDRYQQRPYDNRGGGDRYQRPYDNRYEPNRPPTGREEDNTGNEQPRNPEERYQQRPYDNRYQRPYDNRYEPNRPPSGREEENAGSDQPRNPEDRYPNRYHNPRYDQPRDNRYQPREYNPQRPYYRGDGDGGYNNNRYPPRENRYNPRYEPRDNHYGQPDKPEGDNGHDRPETPRSENRRPLWRAKPDEPSNDGEQA